MTLPNLLPGTRHVCDTPKGALCAAVSTTGVHIVDTVTAEVDPATWMLEEKMLGRLVVATKLSATHMLGFNSPQRHHDLEART